MGLTSSQMRLIVLSLLVLAAAVGSLRVPHPAVASAETDPQPPNVVVVLTDDMRTDEMDALRKTNDLLVDHGTTFTHAIAPTSLCCPARAALLTGTYSHTNNVWSNEGPLGGWPVFQPMEADTIATTLDSLGYQTGYFGKYLNGWGSSSTVSPPGWDSFAATANYGKDPYFGYDIAGTLPTEHMGGAEEDYSTDVYGTRAADFIASTPESTPFLTIFAPHAPHSPFTSAPRYQGSWPLEDLVPPANEQDMGDKPSFMQALPLLKRSQLKATLRKQHEALLPVDDAVQQIVSAVGPSRVANTLFIFTSDNSLMNGDHRMTGKAMPHAGATQIPMVMRWDGVIDSGAITSRLLTLQDVTATIAEAAGATFPTEGISWLSGRRDGSVVEGIESTRDHIVRPAYCGWRTSRYLYVRYSNGAGEELYDYSTDPAELRNAIFNTQYAAIADQMRTAAQSVCDPGPPGFSWDVQPTP